MNLTRRGFLTGMVAVAAITQLPTPSFANYPVLWGDLIHDDTEAIQALLDCKPIIRDGVLLEPAPGENITLRGGNYLISDTLYVRRNGTIIVNGHFRYSPQAKGMGMQFPQSTARHA